MLKCSGIGPELWCGFISEVAWLAVRWIVDTEVVCVTIVVIVDGSGTTDEFIIIIEDIGFIGRWFNDKFFRYIDGSKFTVLVEHVVEAINV